MINPWQIIALNATTPEPWRNGGGMTQALLAWPSLDDWRVRCSVATIAKAGPFSSFAGVQRWFSVLAGAGVRLNIDGVDHAQTPTTSPLLFDGGAKTECTLIHGETTDLNLMFRGCAGTLQTIYHQHVHHAMIGQWLAVYSHNHTTLLETKQGRLTVPAQHLAWLECNAADSVSISTPQAFWMHSTP